MSLYVYVSFVATWTPVTLYVYIPSMCWLFHCSIYTPFNENKASGGGLTFLFALGNALIVVAIVVVMTIVLVCLFKYRCYRVCLSSCTLQ